MLTKHLRCIMISAFIVFLAQGAAVAGGMFGPPEPVSRETAGLQTAVGFWRQEDTYGNATKWVARLNQVYSQAGYGSRNWEVFARIGVADLQIGDALRSTNASFGTARNDFEENMNFFGTLGAKLFHPFDRTYGVGAFIQGTYFLRDFTDTLSGMRSGVPFTAELRVKNLWEANFGIAFQAAIPGGLTLYIGPCLTYSEAYISPSPAVPELEFAATDMTVRNTSWLGGVAGVNVMLGKGFRLNVEGNYRERLSAGTAVTYSY